MKLFKKISLLWSALLVLPLFGEEPVRVAREQSLQQTLTMIVIALLFFYVILWRPEQKRRKKLEATRGSLKKGDEVVAMGILGKVSKIEEESVILEMCEGAKVRFVKHAITEVRNGDKEKEGKASKS